MNHAIFDGFDYDPNQIEDEIFLSQAPLELLMENIRSQFTEPNWDHKNDFVQSFINKYLYTKENELEEEADEIERLHDRFIQFMEDTLYEFLRIGIPGIEDRTSDEEAEEFVHYLYRFFIIFIKKNFVRVFKRYIKKHKEELYEKIPKTKDVAYLRYRNEIDDEVDCQIISKIFTVVEMVRDILQEECDIDTFFDLARSDSINLEIDFIQEKYDIDEINGNFVPYYFDMVDDALLDEITCSVKNSLLKKYTEKN